MHSVNDLHQLMLLKYCSYTFVSDKALGIIQFSFMYPNTQPVLLLILVFLFCIILNVHSSTTRLLSCDKMAINIFGCWLTHTEWLTCTMVRRLHAFLFMAITLGGHNAQCHWRLCQLHQNCMVTSTTYADCHYPHSHAARLGTALWPILGQMDRRANGRHAVS